MTTGNEGKRNVIKFLGQARTGDIAALTLKLRGHLTLKLFSVFTKNVFLLLCTFDSIKTDHSRDL